jgi:hypothetical protein
MSVFDSGEHGRPASGVDQEFGRYRLPFYCTYGRLDYRCNPWEGSIWVVIEYEPCGPLPQSRPCSGIAGTAAARHSR